MRSQKIRIIREIRGRSSKKEPLRIKHWKHEEQGFLEDSDSHCRYGAHRTDHYADNDKLHGTVDIERWTLSGVAESNIEKKRRERALNICSGLSLCGYLISRVFSSIFLYLLNMQKLE